MGMCIGTRIRACGPNEAVTAFGEALSDQWSDELEGTGSSRSGRPEVWGGTLYTGDFVRWLMEVSKRHPSLHVDVDTVEDQSWVERFCVQNGVRAFEVYLMEQAWDQACLYAPGAEAVPDEQCQERDDQPEDQPASSCMFRGNVPDERPAVAGLCGAGGRPEGTIRLPPDS